MKKYYLNGTGWVAGATLALSLVGCGPKSESTTEPGMTNSMSSITNTAMPTDTNAGTAGSSIQRGQYDSNLGTNLHNTEMTMEGSLTNAVTNAPGVAIGEVHR